MEYYTRLVAMLHMRGKQRTCGKENQCHPEWTRMGIWGEILEWKDGETKKWQGVCVWKSLTCAGVLPLGSLQLRVTCPSPTLLCLRQLLINLLWIRNAHQFWFYDNRRGNP